MKHTIGPWNAEGPDEFGDWNIHPPHQRAVTAAVISNVRDAEEVEANAHLVAAAPEMLAALEGVMEMACFREATGERWEKVRDAISKARPSVKSTDNHTGEE